MRIGIFGGSFDPVHVGHLWTAESARDLLQLDSVHWIPTATSPLKRDGAEVAAEDRLAMLRLAIAGGAGHVVDDREISRGDVSYTVDTVAELQDEMPEAELFLIMGSDSLASIRQWKDPESLLQMAMPIVMQRGGQQEIDYSVLDGLIDVQRIDQIRQNSVVMPVIEISSSELRHRIATGQSIRYRTPRAVEAMIDAKGLYLSSRD